MAGPGDDVRKKRKKGGPRKEGKGKKPPLIPDPEAMSVVGGK